MLSMLSFPILSIELFELLGFAGKKPPGFTLGRNQAERWAKSAGSGSGAGKRCPKSASAHPGKQQFELGASEASLFCQKSRRITYYYLVMTNSSPWYRWPIEIDGLPINSMVMFHGDVK